MKASSNGHVAVMEALLRRGANVKDEDEVTIQTCRDWKGVEA
jgi:hypothetical protein